MRFTDRVVQLRMKAVLCVIGVALSVAAAPAKASPISLGPFSFDSNLFGNTLTESDGGTFSAMNWLNTANADPGNPAYLTGANFDTGIANIGPLGDPIYTIGYSTPIVNGSGADLGIVDASYSVNDTYRVAVSTDGVNFTSFISFAEPGTDTGVTRAYYFRAFLTDAANLSVISMDLSDFGLAPGDSITAVRITGSPQADLIRVAGFLAADTAPVPEPATLSLLGLGLAGMGARRWRQRKP